MLEKKEIAKRYLSLFCEKSQKDLAKKIGVQQSVVSEWGTGKRYVPWEKLAQAVFSKGVTWDWLLTGNTSNTASSPAANAMRPREPLAYMMGTKSIPVVGEAAADETQGRRSGFFPVDPELQYSELEIPATISAVKILGNSMAPVLLGGQYALIGPEYMGILDNPRNYEIVIADVAVKDEGRVGLDNRWEGVYCKRIVDAGDTWVFLSINATGTPFSIAKMNCRIWPVVGVWFAGQGKIPEED